MSQLDVRDAKRALAVRLADWGVAGDPAPLASGFIDDLVARGWQMNPSRESRPQPPKVGRACHICGWDVEQVRPDCTHPTTRPTPRDPDTYRTHATTARQLLHPTTEETP